MISLDSETSGVDFNHGLAKPFFVTTCNEEGEQLYWEWEVDPLTREVQVVEEDVEEIATLLNPYNNPDGLDAVVLQNAKFDVKALATLRPEFGEDWLWGITHDTLIAGHLLASNQPHDLTSMVLHYLGDDIEPLEKALEVACKAARALVRRKDWVAEHGQWLIADEGVPGMPSAKEGKWKFDTWLPRAVAKHLDYPDSHPWWTVLRDYANADSAVTLKLWMHMRRELKSRGVWEIYLERMKAIPVAYRMESGGVSLSKARLDQLKTEYAAESARAAEECLFIARESGFDLKLPKGASPNGSLREFLFDHLGLTPMRGIKAKTDQPTLGKAAIEYYESSLPEGPALKFIRALQGKRKRDTALAYMDGYERFWVPAVQDRGDGLDIEGWYRLYPSLNPTGTDTLRWSSSQPNEQNISKKSGFNLRWCFGPLPGREWWSLDAKNLELRIPAYESGERMMVDLFERENDPPYFGSYHLLIFDILHPEKFAKDGAKCKDIYESTWYQYTKNGNFAVTYGAVEESGTADRAYHVPGAQRIIKDRLRDLAALNQKYIAFADKHGYVETLPDRTVNPKRGYPLLCTRSEYGWVLPTVPFNYHVQSSAMWWMMKAMIRCQDKLDQWRQDGFDGSIVLQVHDELVFDLPKRAHPKTDPRRSNLGRIRVLQRLMEQGGEDFIPSIKTPVSVEYHETDWSTGVSL